MIFFEICVITILFVSIVAVVFLFTDRVSEITSEFKRKSEEEGAKSLGELSLSLTPEQLFFIKMILAIGLFFVGFGAIGVVLGGLLAVVGYNLPGVYLRKLQRARLVKIQEQLVGGLELMGNGLKSGLTMTQSIELLVKEYPAPLSQEFRLVLAEMKLGTDLVTSLEKMARRLNLTVVDILVSGISITKQCGGDLTEIFQKIADTIRAQATIEGKLEAVTAQGKFQGMILSFMPFALMAVLYFIDRNHVETLFGYKIGLAAVGCVIGLVSLAQVWINQLLKIDA